MISAFRKLKAQLIKLHCKLHLIFTIANVIMAVFNLSDRFVLLFENKKNFFKGLPCIWVHLNETSNSYLYLSFAYSIVNILLQKTQ